MDAHLAMRLTLSVAAIGVAVSSVEYITRPALLADQSLASWPISRTNRAWKQSPWFGATAAILFKYPNVIAVLVVQLVAALMLVVGGPAQPWLNTVVIAVSSTIVAIRSPYGTDGADQLILIIFVAASLASLVGSSVAEILFVWFVTAQACLAYAIAGIAKLFSPAWRHGTALSGILGTTSYGDRRLGTILARHRRISAWLGWSVIAFECSFPLVLLGIAPLTYFLMGSLLLFHVGALFLMRLNTFLWAFGSTYPSVLFCTLVFGRPLG